MNRSRGAAWVIASRARAVRRAVRRIGTLGLVFAWAALAPVAQAGQQKLLASDGAPFDLFGSSVAMSAETSVIGAWRADGSAGAAYVFVGSGLESRLTATDRQSFDEFGRSVAIDGNTAVVGAPADDIGLHTNRGSAYVFVRSGGAWLQQAQLTSSDGAAADGFGSSVAIVGDTVIVGAPNNDAGLAAGREGAAYVFSRTGLVWTQQQKLAVTDGVALDFFGASAAMSGDTAVIGAPGEALDRGSAYAFVRDASSGLWSLQLRLTPSGGQNGDFFGASVSVSGDTALIGARGRDVGANANQGSAYVFVRSLDVWAQQQELAGSDGAAVDQFGLSVSISGDVAIVGAPNHDAAGNDDRGAAYVYARDAGPFVQLVKHTAGDSEAGDHFGSAVANGDTSTSSQPGDLAVVGASGDDVGRNADQGSAYRIDNLLADPSHDVGISGGGFRTAGHVSADSPPREIVIKVKNLGDHPEGTVPYEMTAAGGPDRTYSAQCAGDATTFSPDGDLDVGEVVSIEGCTVTYTAGAGDYVHRLDTHHGVGIERASDWNLTNNSRTRSTTVVP